MKTWEEFKDFVEDVFLDLLKAEFFDIYEFFQTPEGVSVRIYVSEFQTEELGQDLQIVMEPGAYDRSRSLEVLIDQRNEKWLSRGIPELQKIFRKLLTVCRMNLQRGAVEHN